MRPWRCSLLFRSRWLGVSEQTRKTDCCPELGAELTRERTFSFHERCQIRGPEMMTRTPVRFCHFVGKPKSFLFLCI